MSNPTVQNCKVLRVVFGLNHMLHRCTNLSQFLMNFSLATVLSGGVFNALAQTPNRNRPNIEHHCLQHGLRVSNPRCSPCFTFLSVSCHIDSCLRL